MAKRASEWPIHDFKKWRKAKEFSLEAVSDLLADLGVSLKPRCVQAIEYGYRRPNGADCFKFQQLTDNTISAQYFATFPLRPRSVKSKRKARKNSTARNPRVNAA